MGCDRPHLSAIPWIEGVLGVPRRGNSDHDAALHDARTKSPLYRYNPGSKAGGACRTEESRGYCGTRE